MTRANAVHAESWAKAAGDWIAQEVILDSMMSGILDRILHLAKLQQGEQVLDIGCGTGASCVAAADLLGPDGLVTGVDISAEMLDRASNRAALAGADRTSFLLADAQTHAFPAASFDAMISRFGVMFFEDPVAAFANLKRAARPGGRLVFAAWAPIETVPVFAIPLRAAIARLGKPAPADPDAPGPLAFGNAQRVLGILAEAGLKNPRCLTETVVLAPEGTLAAFAGFNSRVGPAARVMSQHAATEADSVAIEAEIRKGFAAYETPHGIRIPSGVHFYHAET